MPTDKDLVRIFKAARWEDQPSIDAFVKESSPVGSAEIRAVLPLLTDRSLAADPSGHRRRCAAFNALVEANPDERLFEPFVRALKNADPHAPGRQDADAPSSARSRTPTASFAPSS